MDSTKVNKSFFFVWQFPEGTWAAENIKGCKIPHVSYLSPLLRSKPLAVDMWRAPGLFSYVLFFDWQDFLCHFVVYNSIRIMRTFFPTQSRGTITLPEDDVWRATFSNTSYPCMWMSKGSRARSFAAIVIQLCISYAQWLKIIALILNRWPLQNPRHHRYFRETWKSIRDNISGICRMVSRSFSFSVSDRFS